MKRTIFAIYGLLAAGCWALCLWIMIFQPFLSATNNRAFIGFTIMGILFTLIWLLAIPRHSNNIR